MKTSSTLFAILFLSPAYLQADAPLRIVCIGDSVTRGTRPGVTREQTFCYLVEARLKAAGKEAAVVNSGVGSDTTAGGLKRFDKDVLAHQPSHVFIMFGLNDASVPKDKAVPLVPLDQYSANLKKMIDILKQKKITPILMTSNPYVNRAQNPGLKPYIEAVRKVAKEEGVELVDVYARFAELSIEGDRWAKFYPDDCHLNPDGNSFLADVMLPVFLSKK